MANKARNNNYDTSVFARNLQKYLEINELQQKEVAEAIGVSAGSFSEYVKGTVFPRIDKLHALAEYFGVRISDLLEEGNFPLKRLSDEQQELLDLYGALSKKQKAFFMTMLKAMDF